MSIVTTIEPYVDGYIDPVMGNELTVSPRPQYPFGKAPISDTFTRFYERDFAIVPRSIPRISARTAWTNLLTYSEDFDNAAWTKTNLSVTANNATAPNGESNLDKLLETSATGEHSVSQAVTVAASAYEMTVFYKGGLTRGQIRLAFTDSAAVTFSAIFTTTGSALTAAANTTAKLTNLRDGYFRAVIRFTPASGAGTFKVNVSTTGSTISYAGSTSAGIYLWGAQVTLGTLTPYISTTTAARSILAPDRDPVDPFAYLFIESDPEPVNSHREIVRRTFGRIPLRQIVPGSRPIPKPKISGEFPRVLAGQLVTQPDPDADEYTFLSQIAVTFDSGPPGILPGGGTYTLSFDGDTTSALAYNADAATVQAALNGLTSVIAYGSVTVAGSHTAGFTITWAPYVASSVDVSSLSATDATVHISSAIPAGKSQRIIIQPVWTDGAYSMTSSATPTSANPLLTSGGNGQLFKIYGYSLSGGSATGGTYTLSGYSQTTAAIPFTATPTEVKAALDLLSEFTDRGGAYVQGTPLSYASGSLAQNPVTGDWIPVSIGSMSISVAGQPALTGGSFVLNVLGQNTASIAYNASTSTIATAINALSNVTARGGVTVGGPGFSGGKQDFTITFANIAPITGDGSSLTPSGTQMYVTATSSQGLVNTVSFTVSSSSVRTLTANSHGLSATDDIAVTMGGTVYNVAAGAFTLPDANTVSLTSASGVISNSTTATAVGTDNGNRYAADSPDIAVEFITDHYLPGVSPNIDVWTDIPIPARVTPAQLLGAIFGGSTLANYEVGTIAQYGETPVLTITLQTINPQLLVSPDV